MSSTAGLSTGADGRAGIDRPDPPSPRRGGSRRAGPGAQNLSLLAALALLCAGLWIARPDVFPTADNAVNIAISVVLLGLVALPQTLAILSGGIDVSVGSTVGLSSIVAALIAAQSAGAGSAWAAVGLAILTGAACGAFNGIVITCGRVNPFIVTLATYTTFQGLTYIVSQGQATAVLNPTFNRINTLQMLGIPMPVWIYLVIAALFAAFMRYTDFGRNIYALGGNPVAARLAGIDVRRYILGIYVVSGTVAGLAGVILTAQQGSGVPASGASDLSLRAITAVVLGGVILTGGVGTISGTFLAVLILGVLQNGLLLLNVNALYQPVPQGLLLIVAVLIQQWRGQLRLPRWAQRAPE